MLKHQNALVCDMVNDEEIEILEMNNYLLFLKGSELVELNTTERLQESLKAESSSESELEAESNSEASSESETSLESEAEASLESSSNTESNLESYVEDEEEDLFEDISIESVQTLFTLPCVYDA